MEKIQIVIDKSFLRTIDQAARRTQRSRSALVRDALREHLRALGVRDKEIRDKEERDHQGYLRQPQAGD